MTAEPKLRVDFVRSYRTAPKYSLKTWFINTPQDLSRHIPVLHHQSPAPLCWEPRLLFRVAVSFSVPFSNAPLCFWQPRAFFSGLLCVFCLVLRLVRTRFLFLVMFIETELFDINGMRLTQVFRRLTWIQGVNQGQRLVTLLAVRSLNSRLGIFNVPLIIYFGWSSSHLLNMFYFCQSWIELPRSQLFMELPFSELVRCGVWHAITFFWGFFWMKNCLFAGSCM